MGGLFAAAMTGGQSLVYPLDDTYIHLILAKTLASAGVWGIDPQTPVAASSSPLWTLLLAAPYALLGTQGEAWMLYAPLALNMLFLAGLIWLNARILNQAGAPGGLALLITWLFTALPSVAVVGMEHVAHSVLITWFLFQAAKQGEGSASGPAGARLSLDDWLLAAAAACAATIRYESLFIIGPVAAYAFWRGRVRQSFLIGLAAGVPLLAFGLWWVQGGGWMVPNALLLKGATANAAQPGILSWLGGVAHNTMGNLTARPAMVSHTISLIHLFLACWLRPVAPSVAFFSRVTLLGVLAHVLLASFGWLFRYDAWLIQLNLLSILMLLAQPKGVGPRLVWFVMGLCLVVLSIRLLGASVKTPQAMTDRRWEHVMPSDFTRQYLNGKTVLVNDLGVLAYQGGVKVVDLFGLGNNKPLRMRRSAAGYGPQQVSDLAHDVEGDAAIVQLCWGEVSDRLPADWTLIGFWEGARNVVFGDKVVALFSLKPQENARLANAFASFRPTEPVQVHGREFADQFNLGDAALRQSMLAQLCKR